MGNKVNPFLSHLSVTVKKSEKTRRTVKSFQENCATIEEESTVYTYVELDEFTKLYHTKQFMGLINSFNPYGLRIFVYILFNLERDKDWIYLKQSDLMKSFEASEVSIVNGMKNLMDIGIIAKRSTRSEYWINPQLFFNGDRQGYARMNVPNNVKTIRDKKPEVVHVIEVAPDPKTFYEV